jgi:hypothetical protein
MNLDDIFTKHEVFDKVLIEVLKNRVLDLSDSGLNNQEISQHKELKKYNFTPKEIGIIKKTTEELINDEEDFKTLRKFAQTRELRKLNLYEKTLWEYYENSRLPTETTSVITGGKFGDQTTVKSVTSAGDVRAVLGMIDISKERSKIFGSYSPVKAEVSGSIELKELKINYIKPNPEATEEPEEIKETLSEET